MATPNTEPPLEAAPGARERDETVETHQPWITLSTEYPFTSPVWSVRSDRVRTHTGEETTYRYLEGHNSVAVVPVTTDGHILLLRNYRYPVRSWCWEVPAGGIEDGEGSEEAAARELCEEIGGSCPRLRRIGSFFTSNGVSDEQCTVYLAQGVARGTSDREPTELMWVTPVPLLDALYMARHARMGDGIATLALLLCEPYLTHER